MTVHISKRSQGLQASPIRKLTPLAVAAKARGVRVHHLNIGQPDVPAPGVVREAIRRYDPEIIAYSRSEGDPAYVAAIHRYYEAIGHPLPPGAIMATFGGSEALTFAFHVLMDAGQEVIIPEPFYTNYTTFAALAGVRVAPVTTHAAEGFHLPDEATIEAAVSERTGAILLCNPSNPTGVVYTRDEIDRVLRIAERHDLWLLLDEVYREFVFDPRPDDYRTTLELQGASERIVIIDSVSKRYSLCGARLGALVCRNEAVMGAALKLAQARLSGPTIDQALVAPAHDLPLEAVDATIDVYRRRRDVIFEALSAMEGVHVTRPEGAFYTIPKLPIDDSERFASWLLTDFQHEGETLMVAPASGFYATPGLGRDEVRIAYVLEEGALGRAMTCLKRALDTYPGRA